MGEISSFRAALAESKGDNTLWTPLDALEDFLGDIQSGAVKPVRMLILYEEALPNGNFDLSSVRSNLTRAEETHMLALATHLHYLSCVSSD